MAHRGAVTAGRTERSILCLRSIHEPQGHRAAVQHPGDSGYNAGNGCVCRSILAVTFTLHGEKRRVLLASRTKQRRLSVAERSPARNQRCSQEVKLCFQTCTRLPPREKARNHTQFSKVTGHQNMLSTQYQIPGSKRKYTPIPATNTLTP